MNTAGIVAKNPKLCLLIVIFNCGIGTPLVTLVASINSLSTSFMSTDTADVERINLLSTRLCKGDTTTLNAEISGTSLGGQWTVTPEGAGSFSSKTTATTLYIPMMTGAATVTYTTLDPDGSGPCLADSASVDISVQEITYTATIMDIDCFDMNGSIIFAVESDTYDIRLLSQGLIVGDTIITAVASTQVFEIVTDQCSLLDSIAISDLRYDETLPPINISGIVGEDVELTAPNAGTATTLLWIENGEVVIGETQYITRVVAEGNIVDLTVKEGACDRRYQFIITPQATESKSLSNYLANVIHPSGFNSVWALPQGAPYDVLIDVSILDKWGNVAYQGHNIQADSWSGWDGRKAGRIVIPGVYTYLMRAQHQDGRVQVAIGDLTVLQ